jgi:selenocysteine lyase/cysteine desulfurase
VAAWLGAAPERLLLTPGCTSALALAVADLPWTAGDRVLVSSVEHHALVRPVNALAARGVEVAEVPRAADGPLDLDALAHELARGGVRLVAMTAACNVTGELLPLAEIARLAHEHDTLVLIDGAQVTGWLPVDVTALGIDLFAFAGHKACQAPWGIGGLFVAPHVAMTTPAAACALPTSGKAPGCAPMPGYCDGGSVDRVALAGLAAALDWLDAPAEEERLPRARTQVERLARALEERPGVRLYGARAPESRLPTLAFTSAHRKTSVLADAFAHAGVTVAAGLQCAPRAHEALGTAPDGVIRLSVGPTTSEREIEDALAAIERL